jgi:Galactose oxidase, central domain/Thrombospondin type 3 repeat
MACLAVSSPGRAITGGDDAPSATNVFHVSYLGTEGTLRCSAVLVTPTRVLLAAHCIQGALNGEFLNSPNPTGYYEPALGVPIRIVNDAAVAFNASVYPQPGDVATYTPNPAVPGFVPVTFEKSRPINYLVPTAPEHDLAVIPLDRRIPMSQIMPVHLPFDETGFIDECDQNFDGHFYGYGGSYFAPIEAVGSFPRQDAITGVGRVGPSIFGDTYRASFDQNDLFYSFLPDFIRGSLLESLLGVTQFHLIEPGDSGGPMLQGSKLCGINGGIYVSPLSCEVSCDNLNPLSCTYGCGIAVDDLWARVDSIDAVNWLIGPERPLLDSVGHFHGTCGNDAPAGFEDIDTDGDGIPDGCDPCPHNPDAGYMTTGTVDNQPDLDHDGVRDDCDNCAPSVDVCAGQSASCAAPTRNPREVIDGQWLQPDLDQDGVGDVCDKCPFSDVRKSLDPDPNHLAGDFFCCTTDTDCGNPYGIPSHSRCLPLAPQLVGPPATGLLINDCPSAMRCSIGLDSDGDGWQDSCDNCTHESNPDQFDADDDGVGNVCDNCSGSHAIDLTQGAEGDPGPQPQDKNQVSCSTSAQCVQLTGEADSTCIPGKLRFNGTNLTLDEAHCSKLADSDHDTLGDQCDSCPRMQNAKQQNCNKLIEETRGVPYPYVGDACDPNPCSWTNALKANDFDPNNPTAQDLWITFDYHPQRLPLSVLECTPPGGPVECYMRPSGPVATANEAPFNTSFIGTPHATVGGRFCECNPDPNTFEPASIGACKFQCPPDANEYTKLPQNTPWQHPKLVETPPTLPDPQSANFQPEFTGLAMEASRDLPSTVGLGVLSASSLDPTSVSWDLSQNSAGPFPGQGNVIDSYGINAVYWSAVRDVPEMQSASVTTFRAWSNSYIATAFGVNVAPDVVGFLIFNCAQGNCNDPCPTCRMWVDAINLIISPEKRAIAKGLGGIVDVTKAFSDGSLTLLADPAMRWTAAAESGRYLQRSDVGLASVSPDGTTLDAALARVGTQIQPLIRGTRGGGAGFAPAAATSGPPGPPARSDFGVVLSATEHAVFVIGGTLDSGDYAKDIWRYDLVWDEWTPVPVVGGPPPRKVLSATYLPDTRTLYFVDEGKVAGLRQARLLRYDIATDQTTVLGTWLRTSLIDRVFLSGTDDGTLLLTGSSSKLHFVAGVVLRPGDHHVSVDAGFIEQGVLALQPALTPTGLTLPLVSADPSGVANQFTPINELFAPHKTGKGKGKAWGHKPVSVGECL